jgi:hypothetical protein
MNRLQKSTLSAVVLATIGITTAQADSFTDAIKGGTPSLDARLRYESADDDNGASEKANALTVRTRLGYKTGSIAKFSAYIDMEDVRVVAGEDEYGTQTTGFDTIADPESTELNQAYIQYQPIESLTLIGGRQRLLIDNHRFVGNVGFRQNEQTFDAFTVQFALSGASITASYIDQVNGITPTFDALAKDTLFNVGYQFSVGKLSAYYYDLDHSHANNAVKFENSTTGIRFSGNAPMSKKIKAVYTVEYAQQDTPTKKEADYSFIEAGANFGVITALLGYEELGSDEGTYGFQTPLATKHAFNGWADKFLVTSTDGLEDTYIKLVSPIAGLNIVAMYHEFTGNDSGNDFGSEFDLLIEKSFGKNYVASIKWADFKADKKSALTDTEKLWLTGEMKF